ncbi:MAG: tail fiber domain-containing protein [Bacteroidia bacterium]|nr:tail fiber domain-containing protein [Bacteroidia bacterium]
MKKILILLIVMTSFAWLSYAQSPNAFRYQAVARNAGGNVLQNQNVSFRISLLQGSSTGSTVYSEEHAATTNTFGLVNLEIGSGSNVTGIIDSIHWANGPYFIKIELDATGGNTFTEMGVTQLLSVPYALFAAGGNQGTAGPQGLQGPAGNDGLNGQDGVSITATLVQNDSLFITLSNGQTLNAGHVTGVQGIQGIQGIQGDPGTQGNQGQDGISVLNSYILSDSLYLVLSDNTIINAGFVRGAQGLQGIQGEQGIPGDQGPQGTAGQDGLSVTNSYIQNDSLYITLSNAQTFNAGYVRGAQGLQGLQGSPGTDGVNGINGISVVWLGSMATAPVSPNLNEAYYNTTDKKSYVWNGTSWNLISQDGINGAQGPAGSYFAGSGIIISNDSIRNASPDQVISLSGTGSTTVTGTYPNFTISSTDNQQLSINNNQLSITNGDTVTLPTYSPGTGLSLNGATFNSVWTASGNNIFNNNSGNIGIGIQNPTASLHVDGSFRFTDDNEGAGKVLTSDVNGNATWQTPAGGGMGGTGTQNYIPKFLTTSSLDNSLIYQNGTRMGLGTTTPTGRLQIQADPTSSATEPLFEIKDKNGMTVMVVYQDSVRFSVGEGTGKAQNRGAFAVSGKSSSKSFTHNYLYLNPDSTRIYTSDTISGFGVNNIGATSSTSYMKLTPKNYFIGHGTGTHISQSLGGAYNSVLGYYAGSSLNTGSSNIIIGYHAGDSLTSGCDNVIMGYNAGKNGHNYHRNILIGYEAGFNISENGDNVLIGYQSGFNTTVGIRNTAIGFQSLYSNITGCENVAIGGYALHSNIDGANNTALGRNTLYANISGSSNTAVGVEALASNTTGWSNTACGEGALGSNVSGSDNTAVGVGTLVFNTTGLFNTAVGSDAMTYNTSGGWNTGIGMGALSANTTAYDNTAVGSYALYLNTGMQNTAMGSRALYSNTTSNGNSAFGYAALDNNTGSGNSAFGRTALTLNTTGNYNVAVGNSALSYNTTGNNNVSVGVAALVSNKSGYGNVALGYYSAYKDTNGYQNVAIGQEALYENISGGRNVAIGYYAMQKNTSGTMVAVGTYALQMNTTGTSNTAVGYGAARSITTGTGNTAIGNNALSAATASPASYNVAIGSNAIGSWDATGNYNIGIGVNSLGQLTSGINNTAIGARALYSNTTGINNIAIGYYNMNDNISGSNNISTGYYALYNNYASNNLAHGNYALYSNETGISNIAIGDSALYKTIDNFNVAIGRSALLGTGGIIGDYSNNVAIGNSAIKSIDDGDYNTAVGNFAQKSVTTGYNNTSVGAASLNVITTGYNNTAIGYNAGPSIDNRYNTISIGANVICTSSNQVKLGDASITSFYCMGAYAATTANPANMYVETSGQIMRSTSSRRYKKDIIDLEINTSLIYNLHPVSFTGINDNKRHFGLIAEEVAEVIPDMAEFAKEKDVIPGSTSDKLIPDAVKYPLLSVLILKEVQKHEIKIKEQQAMIEAQQQQIENILKENAVLKLQVDQIRDIKNENAVLKSEIEKIKLFIGSSQK